MISLSIVDNKNFMGKLLREETFDKFDLHSLQIRNFAFFEIHKPQDEPAPKWSAVRPFVLSIIKGDGTTPKFFKVVLATTIDAIDLQNTSLFLNISFEKDKITMTTGFSQRGYSLDKSPGEIWDNYMTEFLDNKNINYINNLT